MKNGPYELIIPPVEYPGKKYRGRYAYEHHVVYWQHTGMLIKSGEDLHHKNRCKRDNKFENFEIFKKAEHASTHGKEKGRTMAEFQCPTCGKIFSRERRKTSLIKHTEVTCCSKQCAGSWTHIKKDKEKYQNGVKGNFIKAFNTLRGSSTGR